MSTRTSLIADPDGKSKELAEGLGGLPLCWVSMLRSPDIPTCPDAYQIKIGRLDALNRLAEALPFISELFQDVEVLTESADDFIAHLKKSRAKTIAVDITDPVCMDADSFLGTLKVAVVAIENADGNARTKVGRHTYRTTREVLCHLTTLDPDNGIAEREQIAGDLW